MAVILCAAYLHDIGIPEAERKYQSSAPKYQEQEGPPVAREILIKLGAKEAIIEEVCEIIARHHHPMKNESTNFKVLFDADQITNLEERHKEKPLDNDYIQNVIQENLLTEAGKAEAQRVLKVIES